MNKGKADKRAMREYVAETQGAKGRRFEHERQRLAKERRREQARKKRERHKGKHKNAYRRYLRSDVWGKLRAAVIERAGGKCEFCGEPAVAAHHAVYPKNEQCDGSTDHLVACCKKCHRLSHGLRRSLVDAALAAADGKGGEDV